MPYNQFTDEELDKFQLGLGATGMTPGPVGLAADLTDAGISFGRGNYLAGLLSLGFAIPGLGVVLKGGQNVMKRYFKAAEKFAPSDVSRLHALDPKDLLITGKEVAATDATRLWNERFDAEEAAAFIEDLKGGLGAGRGSSAEEFLHGPGPVDRYLYHVTPTKNVRGIMEKGILPTQKRLVGSPKGLTEPSVSVFDRLDDAVDYAAGYQRRDWANSANKALRELGPDAPEFAVNQAKKAALDSAPDGAYSIVRVRADRTDQHSILDLAFEADDDATVELLMAAGYDLNKINDSPQVSKVINAIMEMDDKVGIERFGKDQWGKVKNWRKQKQHAVAMINDPKDYVWRDYKVDYAGLLPENRQQPFVTNIDGTKGPEGLFGMNGDWLVGRGVKPDDIDYAVDVTEELLDASLKKFPGGAGRDWEIDAVAKTLQELFDNAPLSPSMTRNMNLPDTELLLTEALQRQY